MIGEFVEELSEQALDEFGSEVRWRIKIERAFAEPEKTVVIELEVIDRPMVGAWRWVLRERWAGRERMRRENIAQGIDAIREMLERSRRR